jgi:hypothetical protein
LRKSEGKTGAEVDRAHSYQQGAEKLFLHPAPRLKPGGSSNPEGLQSDANSHGFRANHNKVFISGRAIRE